MTTPDTTTQTEGGVGHRSPFVLGARVAVRQGFEVDYSEDFVLKVYKNGNFTIRKNPRQQWRPSTNGFAYKTGPYSYGRSSLRIWDEATDHEISEARGAADRRSRFAKAVDQLRATAHLTPSEELVAALEAALALTTKAEGR